MMNGRLFDADVEETTDDVEFYTPPALIETLGKFDLDPCGAKNNNTHRLAETTYTLFDGQDGLHLEWFGRVWLNPPYGRTIESWLQRMVKHGNGIALIPCNTSSRWFHELVFGACDGILFVRKRISFIRGVEGKSQSPTFASVFVAYGKDNAESICTAQTTGNIDGHYIQINQKRNGHS